MADVLIRGMEMPKSCLECRLFNDPWCMAKKIDQWRTAYYRPEKGEKQKDCPLIEVPEHGRLIDASELVTVQLYDEEHEEWPQVAMTIDDLLCQGWVEAEAKTVIPASGKGAE